MDFSKQWNCLCVLMDVRGQRPNQIGDISFNINKLYKWIMRISNHLCPILVKLENYRQ